jgi:hypothetical protein
MSFASALDVIHQCAIRDNSDDKVRCAVCGVFWLPDDIAINVRQLRLLTGRSKSSINGFLQKIDYRMNLSSALSAFLKDHPAELRKWTARTRDNSADRLLLPPLFLKFTGKQSTKFEICLGGIGKPWTMPMDQGPEWLFQDPFH